MTHPVEDVPSDLHFISELKNVLLFSFSFGAQRLPFNGSPIIYVVL